jgi:hypothetical protein
MAMGLDFLGRGRRWGRIQIGSIHILGAAFGGALVGGLLGWLGSLLSLSIWRPEIIVVIAIFALWHSVSSRPTKLGCQRQVPRKLKHFSSIQVYYFYCGAQLGCGVATLIPYSCLLVILGAQLTSGFVLGLVSGILFGGTREGLALLAPLEKHQETSRTDQIMQLLPKLAPQARKLNIIWIVAGSLFLALILQP